jgi:hypothetical protein
VDGIATPKSFEDKLEKMLTALCLLGREGTRLRFGDDPRAGSMNYWNDSSGDGLRRLLCTDIKTYLVELQMNRIR